MNHHVVLKGFAIATIALLSVAKPSMATHEISSCDHFCDTDCTGQGSNCAEAVGGVCILDADPETGVLECGQGEGPIVLKNGTALDLHGHTLKCEDGVNCNDGIKMEGTGGKVFSTVSSSESLITGGFLNAVNCQSNGNTEVSGITIAKAVVGVRNCKKILDNVIKTLGRTYLTANWGIQTAGVTQSGDLIENNYIEGRLYGIRIEGTKKPTVQHNVIHTTHYGSCAIQIVNSDSEAKIFDNIILGTGNGGFTGVKEIICLPNPAPTSAQFAGNICNEDHPDCTTCAETEVGGNTLCVPLTSPFNP